MLCKLRPRESRTPQTVNEWLTPPALIAALGAFDLDPCDSRLRAELPWKTAARSLTAADDGLSKQWNGRVWLNPPYGYSIHRWMRRMAQHNHGTAFVFARTETSWFFDSVWSVATGVLFLRKRVQFARADGSPSGCDAPSPSVLVAYGKQDFNALKESGLDGRLIRLRP